MLNYLYLFLLVLVINPLGAQVIERKLNGISLGQFREVPANSLGGLLDSGRFEDGFEYEMYLVEPDTSVYMIFEYAHYDLGVIWSVQLTGNKVGYDCKFKELRLGMTADQVKQLLGEPDEIADAGEYGDRWGFNKTNFTLEITPDGKLGGIKLIDMSLDYFPNVDVRKIPPANIWIKLLSGKSNSIIESILAPSIEIYKEDSTYFYNKSIREELADDYSSIFKLCREAASFFRSVDLSDTLQYEENMRLSLGADPLHVVKGRKGNKYVEMVFKYMFGKYLIWEIKFIEQEK